MSQHNIETLYREHHSWLHRWLRGRLGCEHSAADIAHDTYIKVMLSNTIPTDDQPRRYLTRIAKSLVIDLFRRRQIEAAYLETVRHLPEQDIPSEETQHIVVETLLEIDQMLQTLPNHVRQAFLMRKLDGMSYREIAAVMNVSVSSVEKYVAKALTACFLHSVKVPS
ncbi:MAG: sigma-70 family RNA polymerase sigma factor [Pseudomonadota bacterium]|uniref:sigma-70 family RNA polymerase sigma factor n=1 Tax=Methylophaga aminisulfidivorans TaxID=230105 RepID=UPI0024E1C80B|nr:sigma-70 family RNA polymerase sigma factor [Methylophaga aminisulfidivorans]MEC9413938.1 sigma-70 family RNA polymerase sigma factor [Pseudomonadota bacterium]